MAFCFLRKTWIAEETAFSFTALYMCAYVCSSASHSPINHGVKEAARTNTINKAEFLLSFANRFVHAPTVSLPFLAGSQSNIQTCTTPRTLSS